MKLKVIGRLTVMGLLCAYSFTAIAQKTSDTKSNAMNGVTRLNVMSDSDQGNDKTMILEKGGEKYRIRVIDNKITELEINGKKQPETEFAKYDSMVTAILEQIAKDQAQAEKDRRQADKDRERADRDRARADLERAEAEKEREKAELDRDRADEERKQADLQRKQADLQRHQADLERKQAEAERERNHEDRERAEHAREDAAVARKQAELQRAEAERDRERAQLDRKRAEVDRARAEEDRKLLESLIDDLVSEKLIKSKNGAFEIQLTTDALTIDGKKQPDALHQKYKSKFLKNMKNIRFSSDGHSRRLEVNDDN